MNQAPDSKEPGFHTVLTHVGSQGTDLGVMISDEQEAGSSQIFLSAFLKSN